MARITIAALVLTTIATWAATPPEDLVANTLRVKREDVTIQQTAQGRRGEYIHIRARVGQENPVRVVLTFTRTSEKLHRIRWPDQYGEQSVSGHVSKAQAVKRAKQLVDRFFPPIPAELELVETYERTGLAPAYMFTYQAPVRANVFTGDMAVVRINSKSGKPMTYMQTIARKRPGLEEIDIDVTEALRISTRHIGARYDEPVQFEVVDARLVLSSLRSPRYGPVWHIRGKVKFRGRDRIIDRQSVAVDAMSGAVLEPPR
ncbi:MAG: hypothetical protein R6V19_11560 [Armatimonadota bacterium]